MAMVPHERSLVKRMEGKPFALIGVNFDNSRKGMQDTVEQHQINWRSFFNGREGPIGKQWNIRYLPTIYVLDHKGVIRHKDLRDRELDNAVEALVKEAERDGKANK
jgi:AhpC/TSA family